MLSKAEVMYLQGQKTVSQSYERKLKCLIRKKIDVLQKELLLLSKLLAGQRVMSFTPCDQVGEVVPLSNHNGQEHSNHNFETSDSSFKRATKYSNLDLKDIEIEADEDVKSQNIDEIDALIKDNSTAATEFSNVQFYDATKNSDSSNSINIARCFPNPLTNTPISHENPDKSIQNDLISEWAGSDSNQRPPPCQGGILTRLDHRP